MRLFALICVLTISSLSFGSPIVRIGDGRPTTWTQGMTATNVKPNTDGLSSQAATYYGSRAAANGLGGGPNPVVPILTPDVIVSDGSTSRQSLVMSWTPTGTNTLEVAGWVYDYNGDPDLTGFIIDFEAFAPAGIDSLGVELVDGLGRTKSWFRTGPIVEWDPSYVFSASGNLQAPFTQFGMDPGFDLVTVATIRFTEAARFDRVFSQPDPTGQGTQWNAWAHLDVVPEPTTLVVIGAGVLALGIRRRGQSKN